MYNVPVYKIHLVKDSNVRIGSSVTSPHAALDVVASMLGNLDVENFVAILLDAKNRVIGCHLVSVGGITEAQVSVAGTFKAAILSNAVSIIVAHNHPSGEVSPSPEDIEVTRRLIAAGRLLDIEVLDHIIYADSDTPRHASLRTMYGILWKD